MAYPATFDNLATNRQNNVGQAVDAVDINNIAASINRIEQALGIAPAGADATVAARLARIETVMVSVASPGTEGQVLTLVSGRPTWTTLSTTPATTRRAIITAARIEA